MKITFKSKPLDGFIKTPRNISKKNVVERSYEGERWDGVINSTILHNVIMRKIKSIGLDQINLNALPANVSVTDGFLKEVTIDLGPSF